MHTPKNALSAVVRLVIALLAVVPSLAWADDNTLVRFEGGIGVDAVSNAPGPGPIAMQVTRNIVRGVQPAGQLWAIAEFSAEVAVDGHIRAEGRGLVFAGGDTIGTAIVPGGTASLRVFATLICENVPPFVERNTRPVPLAANGDFQIDDVLTPPPPPSACATPALLIRNAGNQAWFSAGIQNFEDDDGHSRNQHR